VAKENKAGMCVREIHSTIVTKSRVKDANSVGCYRRGIEIELLWSNNSVPRKIAIQSVFKFVFKVWEGSERRASGAK